VATNVLANETAVSAESVEARAMIARAIKNLPDIVASFSNGEFGVEGPVMMRTSAELADVTKYLAGN
jgi:hypothetical protein